MVKWVNSNLFSIYLFYRIFKLNIEQLNVLGLYLYCTLFPKYLCVQSVAENSNTGPSRLGACLQWFTGHIGPLLIWRHVTFDCMPDILWVLGSMHTCTCTCAQVHVSSHFIDLHYNNLWDNDIICLCLFCVWLFYITFSRLSRSGLVSLMTNKRIWCFWICW